MSDKAKTLPPLTTAELDSLAKAHADATPGEWRVGETAPGMHFHAAGLECHNIWAGGSSDVTVPCARLTLADANFIVASHTLLPRLIADLDHARRMLDDMVKERWSAVEYGRALEREEIMEEMQAKADRIWKKRGNRTDPEAWVLEETADAIRQRGPAPEPLPADLVRQEAESLRAENGRLRQALRDIVGGWTDERNTALVHVKDRAREALGGPGNR